ncbi:MAG TPA: rhomboid family intramembrane serine protease [Bacteroidales bacterium]|nr:rhomboid family intramembrane serine protease [Bacteroidales bacterium]HPT01165.1 rhomboid family intramembrane serine protease [Bacteroidales bacterium]
MPVTLFILVITILVSILAFSNQGLYRRMAFNPYDIRQFRNGYRFLSYALVHADWVHLLINMLVLYSFGRAVEVYYGMIWGLKGQFYYFLLYAGGIVFSTTPAYAKHKDDYTYTAVGASGAISAVVFASIIFDPLNKIYIFMIPFGIPAVIFGLLYLVYSWYMAKKNVDNIGHDVHFWGAVFGFVFTIALKPSLALHFVDTLKMLLG